MRSCAINCWRAKTPRQWPVRPMNWRNFCARNPCAGARSSKRLASKKNKPPAIASTRRLILSPDPGDRPFVARAFNANRGAVAGLEVDDLARLVAAQQLGSRAQQIVDMTAHHEVAFGCGDFGEEGCYRIAGV